MIVISLLIQLHANRFGSSCRSKIEEYFGTRSVMGESRGVSEVLDAFMKGIEAGRREAQLDAELEDAFEVIQPRKARDWFRVRKLM